MRRQAFVPATPLPCSAARPASVCDARRPRMSLRDAQTVIVGGGPAGFTAALLLAEEGWKNVTLFERSHSPHAVDPNRSFSYLLSSRGRNAASRIPDLLPRLEKASIPSSPASLFLYGPRGPPKVRSLDLRGRAPGLWLRRAKLLELLHDAVKPGTVRIELGASVDHIDFSATGTSLRVRLADGDLETLRPDLIIACDGSNSIVREALRKDEVGDRRVHSSRGFEVDRWESPATSLMYKTLTLPKSMSFTNEGKEVVVEPRMICAFHGDGTRRRNQEVFRMGLLPVGKDVSDGRTGTIVRPADNALWDIHTAEDAFPMFDRNFPQLAPFRNIVDEAEMERFAACTPAKFPRIARVRSLVGLAPKGAGVALVGDAAHVFPPDLGQGVNAAMEDVALLVDAMCEADKDVAKSERCSREKLHDALRAFESGRDEDISALMQLMIIGGPYQYGQSRIGIILWGLDLAIRRKLVHFLPKWFHPHVFDVVNDDKPGYAAVLARHCDTTRNMGILLGSSVAIVASVLALYQIR